MIVAVAIAFRRRILPDLLGSGGQAIATALPYHEAMLARADAPQTSRLALIHVSKPQAQRGLHAAHGIGRGRQSELRAVDGGIPTREGGVIENVRGVDPQIEIEAAVQAERAPQRSVQS